MPCGGRTSDWTICSSPAPTIRTTSPTAACRSSGSRVTRPSAIREARGRKRWHDNQRRYNANLSWAKGTHGFRFGFDLSHEHMNHWQIEAGGGPRGDFAYGGGTTAIRNGPAPNQHNAFAAFLLGLPSSVGKAVAPELPLTTRAWRQGFYARDQWQATPDLTLTLGVRAEYYPVVTRKNSGVALYDVTTNTVRIGGVGSVPRDVGVSERLHFAPRLGAAYRIGDKWVVRGGFGVSTDPFSLARLFRTNYPAIVAMDIVARELVPVRRANRGWHPARSDSGARQRDHRHSR